MENRGAELFEKGNVGETLCALLDAVPEVVDAAVNSSTSSFGGETSYGVSVVLDNGRALEIDVRG